MAKWCSMYADMPRSIDPEFWVRDSEGGVRPSFEELHALIGFLERGEPIDATTRGIIAAALTYLSNWLFDEAMSHQRGRAASAITFHSAAVVNELHEKHGIKILAAARAVVDPDVGTADDRRKLQGNIERKYRTLKASGGFGAVSEVLVSKALSRLNSQKKRKK